MEQMLPLLETPENYYQRVKNPRFGCGNYSISLGMQHLAKEKQLIFSRFPIFFDISLHYDFIML